MQSTSKTLKSLFWWFVFASAFAMTEAALVINVRRMLGWEPGLDYAEILTQRGLRMDSQTFTRLLQKEGVYSLELSREAATILLLVAAAMAAGKTWRERWGLFWFTFAIWDLAYYVFLYIFIGFPRNLTATDVYFLIPITWYGPVWFPVCIVMPGLLFFGLYLMTILPTSSSRADGTDQALQHPV